MLTVAISKYFTRELLEEANVTVSSLDRVGVLTFEFDGEPELLEVHVFKSQQYEGLPQESEGTSDTLYSPMHNPRQLSNSTINM